MGLPPACCQRVRARSAERGGRLALDDHLHVVHAARTACAAGSRRRGSAGWWAAMSQRRTVKSTPPQYATSSSTIDELLVMRRADRQVAVEQDLDALRSARPEDPARKQLAVHGVQDGVVPQQNSDLEVRAPLQQPAQQLAELDGRAVGRPRVALEPRAAVQLPAQNEDRALRGEQRSAQRFEIVSRRR